MDLALLLNSFLLQSTSKEPGPFTYLVGVSLVAVVAMVLFFTGFFGKISEVIGRRLEKSDRRFARAIGVWLADRDPDDLIAGRIPTDNTSAPTTAGASDLGLSSRRDMGEMPEIYSKTVLLEVARNCGQDVFLDQRLAEQRAMAAALKYIDDLEATEEYRAAVELLPWLADFTKTHIELKASQKELAAYLATQPSFAVDSSP